MNAISATTLNTPGKKGVTIKVIGAEPHEERGSFSRARHFALILIPVVLGQSWVWLTHYFSHAETRVNHDAIIPQMLISDSNGWLHAVALFFLLFGLGSALAVLHAVRLVEEDETCHPERARL